jgi:hypothetical protein
MGVGAVGAVGVEGKEGGPEVMVGVVGVAADWLAPPDMDDEKAAMRCLSFSAF